MHESPEPTEREQEQAPERLDEEQAKSGQGHENPQQPQEEDDSE